MSNFRGETIEAGRVTEKPPHDETSFPAIEFRNVTKVFHLAAGHEVVAVDRFSTTIAPREFVCVLGPSGHGKSTLLNLVGGFIFPTSGQVLAHGKLVQAPGPDRGVVFQRDTVLLWLRVADNIEYGLKAQGVPAAKRKEIVTRLLDIVGLTKFARAWPRELSGGMRRRVVLAAVFANEPRLLLLDEPFGALDYGRRASLHRVLVELWSRVKNTVFFVTHDIDEALALATRIMVVVRGRIVHESRLDSPCPRDGDALASPEVNMVRLGILDALTNATATADDMG